MPNAKSIKRKLDRRVIGRYGLDTVFYRTASASGYDAYGEPIGPSWAYSSGAITIVVDTDKRVVEGSDIGGLPDDKREFIYFYCSGGTDIRIGDKVNYPADGSTMWLVETLVPNMMNGLCLIIEVKAFRDTRY